MYGSYHTNTRWFYSSLNGSESVNFSWHPLSKILTLDMSKDVNLVVALNWYLQSNRLGFASDDIILVLYFDQLHVKKNKYKNK